MNTYFTNQAFERVRARPELMAQMPYYGATPSHLADVIPPKLVIVHIGGIYPVRDWRLFAMAGTKTAAEQKLAL